MVPECQKNKTGDGEIMARGVRKSPREKLEEKLISVEEAITQYSECLEKLRNGKPGRVRNRIQKRSAGIAGSDPKEPGIARSEGTAA